MTIGFRRENPGNPEVQQCAVGRRDPSIEPIANEPARERVLVGSMLDEKTFGDRLPKFIGHCDVHVVEQCIDGLGVERVAHDRGGREKLLDRRRKLLETPLGHRLDRRRHVKLVAVHHAGDRPVTVGTVSATLEIADPFVEKERIPARAPQCELDDPVRWLGHPVRLQQLVDRRLVQRGQI